MNIAVETFFLNSRKEKIRQIMDPVMLTTNK